MSYWDNVQIAAGMGGKYHWVLLTSLVLALLLAAFRPEAKSRLRVAILLIAASFVTTLFCAALLTRGIDVVAAGYRYPHFIAQVLLAIALINVAGVLIFRVLLSWVRLEPAPILRDTMLGLAYCVAALSLLSRHGVNLSGIIATSAVVTAVIGFSLQDTLGNVMGGMALQLERSIAAGDWIHIAEFEGIVREIRWRQTTIETRNGDAIILPNSVLMKSQVMVLGRRSGQPRLRRVWVNFNVDFRHSPGDVMGVVERAMVGEAIPNVAASPSPLCILKDFHDSYGQYSAGFWMIDFAQDGPTRSEVRARIYLALKRAGMSLSIPAQRTFVTLENSGRTRRKLNEETFRRAQALKNVTILQPLTDDERNELSQCLTTAPFRKGEIITRQGDAADYLYVIARGDAEVRVAVNGDSRAVATLGKLDVFGEMAMLTGEPRTATVISLSDMVCYRLDKTAFQDIIQRRPEIADAIANVLARRKMELDGIKKGMGEEALHRHLGHTQSELLHKIRGFFMLD